MVRRISTSQIKSKLRQAQQKRRQAIDKYKQAVRQRNQNVRRAVNKYNQEVRSYNVRVRANRQRLKNEFAKLSRPTTTKKYIVYSSSVQTLSRTYNHLEQQAESQHWDLKYNRILDLSEREAANSFEVANRLLGNESGSEEHLNDLQDASLVLQLREISEDLDNRWQGAVFALDPKNPDAARHFCTSAREIITKILEIKAPDAEVLALLPNSDKTELGKPTRRSKIRYFLHRKGMTEEALEEFAEHDMENIIELFQVFNIGTHGSAGTFDLRQLASIKKRVEDGIVYLAEIIGEA